MPFRERVVLHLAIFLSIETRIILRDPPFLGPLLLFSFFLFFFCDNWIHSKSKVAVCSFGKSTMIRHCLSSRDISSRVYSPLTCCVSVTLAPHSSIQTLSRVYNSNSDGPRLPSFRIHDPLIRFIHSRVKNTGLLKWRRFKLFYSRRFEFLIFSLSLFFSLITFIYQIFAFLSSLFLLETIFSFFLRNSQVKLLSK